MSSISTISLFNELYILTLLFITIGNMDDWNLEGVGIPFLLRDIVFNE